MTRSDGENHHGGFQHHHHSGERRHQGKHQNQGGEGISSSSRAFTLKFERKKYVEDQQMGYDDSQKMSNFQPLPTLQSLAKKNKKLQRVLRKTLKHKAINKMESNEPNPAKIADSSHYNPSICSSAWNLLNQSSIPASNLGGGTFQQATDSRASSMNQCGAAVANGVGGIKADQ